MILPFEEFIQEGPPLTWDNTMRCQLRECPRKLFYFLRGYDYLHTPAYFVWGRAWGAILNAWYSSLGPRKETAEELRTLCAANALNQGLALWDQEGGVDVGGNKRSSLQAIFEAYVDQYPHEPWVLIEGGGEVGWEWPLPKEYTTSLRRPYLLGGAFDGLVRDLLDARVKILETKTTGGYITSSYLRGWQLSTQVRGYAWYAQEVLGGDYSGVIINMATKNVPGPRSNWSTPRFARTIIKPSDADLEEFLTGFAFDLMLAEAYWQYRVFPKTTNEAFCVGSPGRAPCLFLGPCSVLEGDDYKTTDLPSSFNEIGRRKGEWEPWKRKGDDA